MSGSGFVPSGIFGAKLGAMAAILAETDEYAEFVGDEIAELGACGMYFYGVDRRDLAATEEDFPDRMFIWNFGDDYERYSTQAGGTAFKFRGSLTLVVEAGTPEEYARNTPAAYDWIMCKVSGMVRAMELLYGQEGKQEIASVKVAEGPYRECEPGEEDYVGVVIEFELRN